MVTPSKPSSSASRASRRSWSTGSESRCHQNFTFSSPLVSSIGQRDSPSLAHRGTYVSPNDSSAGRPRPRSTDAPKCGAARYRSVSISATCSALRTHCAVGRRARDRGTGLRLDDPFGRQPIVRLDDSMVIGYEALARVAMESNRNPAWWPRKAVPWGRRAGGPARDAAGRWPPVRRRRPHRVGPPGAKRSSAPLVSQNGDSRTPIPA